MKNKNKKHTSKKVSLKKWQVAKLNNSTDIKGGMANRQSQSRTCPTIIIY